MLVFPARDEYPRDDTGGHHLFGCVDGRQEAFVESFETYRPYLFAIAYRMLGSAMDAEDLVQETYLRSQAAPPESIHSLKAFLSFSAFCQWTVGDTFLAIHTRDGHFSSWE